MPCRVLLFKLSGEETYLSSPEFCLLCNSDIIPGPSGKRRVQVCAKETTVTTEECATPGSSLGMTEMQPWGKMALK